MYMQSTGLRFILNFVGCAIVGNQILKLFELISIFIGTIGHVAHGKSTVVKALSGVQVLNSRFDRYAEI